MTEIKKSSGVPLYELSADVQHIISILEDNGGELTPELEAIFDASSEALALKLDNCLVALKSKESLVGAISGEIDRLSDWLSAEGKKCDWLKGYILNNMLRAGVEKSEGVHGRLTVAKGRESVQVDGIGFIPTKYLVEKPATWSADKKALKEAIKRGEEFKEVRIVVGNKTLKVK